MPATKEQCRKFAARLKLRVAELIGNRCVVCNKNRKVEYAHIKPTKLNGAGRGLKQRYIDILRNPMHYVPMCHYHHVRFDAFEFELVLYAYLRGRNVIIYNPPRRSCNRRKGRRSDPDGSPEQCSSDCVVND